MSVVVSLFSEVDGDLEHDTLSVMGRDTMAGRDVWVVRFADPVITTRYLVDAQTRAILDAVTTQRKGGDAVSLRVSVVVARPSRGRSPSY